MIKVIENPLFKKIQEKYGYNFFIVIGIIGVFLIFISEFEFTDKTIDKEDMSESYRIQLENSLSELLSEVSGAGKVKIMITLESGQENVYAWQEKTSRDEQISSETSNSQSSQRKSYENEIVMIENGNEKQALIEKTLQPVIQGVVVVCQGAEDIKVVSDITNAVSVALNLPSNRICVIKMQ